MKIQSYRCDLCDCPIECLHGDLIRAVTLSFNHTHGTFKIEEAASSGPRHICNLCVVRLAGIGGEIARIAAAITAVRGVSDAD